MRRFRAAKKRLDDVVNGMIRARSAEAGHGEASLERHGDLLSMLVAARDDQAGGDGHKLDPQQIRDQVLTLFLAGYETVANALAWTWLLLGQNPEAESRFHAELDAVLGDRLPTFEDIPDSSTQPWCYRNRCGSIHLRGRWGAKCLQDVSIGPYRLRKGTMVFFSQYIVQRDPQWFPEPERFLPRAIYGRSQSGPAAVRLLSLWRRGTAVYRGVVRLDGGNSDTGYNRAALAS